ncbi:FHA domain-containing protein [Lentisphaerota bacterium WC36G]|nr:FHA domain-containing protein [Lentisphaerae bacterium WC36]
MKIFIKSNNDSQAVYELSSPVVTVGSGGTNSVVLEADSSVAELHAQFVINGEKYMLVDLGSTAGTIVNGNKMVGPHILKVGDQITFGNQTFTYCQDEQNSKKSVVQFSPAAEKNSIPKSVKFSPATDEIDSKQTNNNVKENIFSHNSGVVDEAGSLENDFGEETFFAKNKVEKTKEKKSLKKKIFDIIFYLLVLILAGISVFFFVMMQNKQKSKTVIKVPEKKEFFLSYEKVLQKDNNVFNFRLTIKNNKAQIILDDLLSQRSYIKDFNINNESVFYLDTLKASIEKTKFQNLKEDKTLKNERDSQIFKEIKIYDNGVLTKYIATNEYPPTSFNAVENAIDDFVAALGYSSLPKSPEELQEEAKKLFLSANDFFGNWLGAPENLLLAKLRYERAIEYLDQFDPKPAMWVKAKRKLAECTKLIKQRQEQLTKDYKRAQDLEQHSDMLKAVEEKILLTSKNDEKYKDLLELRAQLEDIIRKKGGK